MSFHQEITLKMNQHQIKPQHLHPHLYPTGPPDLSTCNNHQISTTGTLQLVVTHNNANNSSSITTTSTTQTAAPGEKSYKCDLCNKSFAHSYSLQRHVRTHSGDKPYSCDICHKSFTAKSSLQRHLNSHTGEKPFKCEVCHKAFTRKNILQRHSRTHTTGTG